MRIRLQEVTPHGQNHTASEYESGFVETPYLHFKPFVSVSVSFLSRWVYGLTVCLSTSGEPKVSTECGRGWVCQGPNHHQSHWLLSPAAQDARDAAGRLLCPWALLQAMTGLWLIPDEPGPGTMEPDCLPASVTWPLGWEPAKLGSLLPARCPSQRGTRADRQGGRMAWKAPWSSVQECGLLSEIAGVEPHLCLIPATCHWASHMPSLCLREGMPPGMTGSGSVVQVRPLDLCPSRVCIRAEDIVLKFHPLLMPHLCTSPMSPMFTKNPGLLTPGPGSGHPSYELCSWVCPGAGYLLSLQPRFSQQPSAWS
jgi:hypothetical protein